MGEYNGKKFEEPKIKIMHYSDKTGLYKNLTVNPTDRNDSVFFSIMQGVKGQDNERITVALNKQEISYLIMSLTKIFNDLD